MPDLTASHNCKYYEICRRPAASENGYCILHLPTVQKPRDEFRGVILGILGEGRADFRFVYFPAGEGAMFNDREFPEQANFGGVVIPDGLYLNDSCCPHGLIISCSKTPVIDLKGVTVRGAVSVEVSSVTNFHANSAVFHGDMSVTAGIVEKIDLHESELHGSFRLRGQVLSSIRFDYATVEGLVDLKECELSGSVSFRGTTFSAGAELDLSRCNIKQGGLNLDHSSSMPAYVHLDGAVIQGDVHLQAEMGKPYLKVVAQSKPPRFHGKGEVRLANVDMGRCRVLGNDLKRWGLVNVQWDQRLGRACLLDERTVRMQTMLFAHLRIKGASLQSFSQWWENLRKPPSDVGNLKETYQALKQAYAKNGNHKEAAEFHYGEMEMQRREYGWPKRFLCPELLYWLLSGYGIGYVRALVILLVMIAGSALMYHLDSPNAFAHGFLDALYFSAKVTAFQRPDLPTEFSAIAKWWQLAQSILGPLQIALFGLALRMRLKQ